MPNESNNTEETQKTKKKSTTDTLKKFKKENTDKLIHGGDLSKYGNEFQIKLLSLLIKDRVFSLSIVPIIKSEYFSDVYLRRIYDCIKEYIETYSSIPIIDNVRILLTSKNEKMIVYDPILEKINEISLDDRDFVVDNARKFCFSKHALLEMEKMKECLEDGDFAKAKKVSLEAFKYSGLNTRKTYDLKTDYEKIYQDDILHRPVELPFPSFNKATKGGPGSGNLVVMVASSNFGKCFAKGTKLIMYDGTLKSVEDIQINDKLLGPDGKERNVTSLAQGEEEMYEIQQDRGISYIVNKSHILVLYRRKENSFPLIETNLHNENTICIEVSDYLNLSNGEKENLYGIKKYAEYQNIYKISLVEKGIGKYYGFTLSDSDPDRMFLLEDFTVVHNTAALTACARHANSLGKNVAFFSYEIGGVDILRRYIAGVMDVKQEELRFYKDKIKGRIVDSNLGNFRLLEQRATLATVDNLRTDLDWLKSTGFFPDMICVDSLNQLKWSHGRARDDNEKFEYIAEDLRDLANEEELPLLTVFQTNRSGFNTKINNIDTIGKAIEPFQVADLLITYAQDHEMFLEQKCTALLLKNRLGPKNIALECSYDPNLGVFRELKQINEILLLSDKQRQGVLNVVKDAREKLKVGDFLKK